MKSQLLFSSPEICILAGGLSQRMGRDKSRLKLGQKTMLAQIRAAARATGLPVRIIRRDRLPRCGPLGGIYTALASTRAQAVLFLACDMPFVTTELMQSMLPFQRGRPKASFTRARGAVGFPLLLPRRSLPLVARQIKRRELSLQALAKVLGAKIIRPPSSALPRLLNVNTPGDLRQARRMIRQCG